jgi:tRNA(fMet)-specific endonuclease VapC
LRGLKAKGATKQLAAFDLFCTSSRVLPLIDEVIVKASEIYADLYVRGQLISDADILIAATALFHGHGVATNNEKHFRRIAGLVVDNWLK